MITKKDIAEKLGVSRTTVSMVLNRKPDARISEETAQRVLAMARKLGYKEQGQTETQSLICYILCNRRFDRQGYFESLRSLELAAFESNFRIIFLTLDHSEDDYDKVESVLKSSGVKGVIIAGDFDKEVIEYIQKLKMPFVVNGVTDIDGINLVSPDHYLAGYEATEHLIGLGHRNIAFFTGELYKLTHKRILAGYREALQKYNIVYDPSLVQVSTREHGDDLVRRAKELDIHYTAILTANVLMGIDTLTELKAGGRAIPKELSIISIGGGSLGFHSRPKLSVMAGDGERNARAILDILVRNINNYDLEPQIFISKNTLVERESTGPCPI